VATSLGTKIREARRAAGFKNAETFAVALRVGVRTVQRWEAGENDPSIKRMVEIARVTNQPLSFFIGSEVAA
jgi:transcriptional regulator with XRE-family HTH domain